MGLINKNKDSAKPAKPESKREFAKPGSDTVTKKKSKEKLPKKDKKESEPKKTKEKPKKMKEKDIKKEVASKSSKEDSSETYISSLARTKVQVPDMGEISEEAYEADLNKFVVNYEDYKPPGTVKSIVFNLLGVLFVILGTVLCINTMKAITNQVSITDGEKDKIASLNQTISELTSVQDSLPEASEEMVKLINVPTAASEDVKNAISRLAGINEITLTSKVEQERKNESDIVKVYYTFEGRGKVSNILNFVEDVRTSDIIVLVEEIYITEPIAVSIGSTTLTQSDELDFRVQFQHSYSQGDIENIGAEFEGSTDIVVPEVPQEPDEPTIEEPKDPSDGELEDSEDINNGETEKDPNEPSEPETPSETPEEGAHTHKFEEWGWNKSASHSYNGEQVRVCITCNEVETKVIEAGPEYHDWDGPCNNAKCNSCGVKSDGTHMFGPWVVLSDSTCYVDGVLQRTCINPHCSMVETKVLPIKDHKPVQGSDSWYCEVCGESVTDPSLGQSIVIG